MRLGEKLRDLRARAGEGRGFGRPLTKAEVARLMARDLGSDRALSAAYLSQLESGARGHMTERSRAALAAFFGVHPGYLVSDPDDFQAAPLSGHSTGSHGHGHAIAQLARRVRQHQDPAQALRAVELLLELPPERWQALIASVTSERGDQQ